MRIDIITLFPDAFRAVSDDSIIGRARRNGTLEINLHQLRDYSHDKHHTVDDTPFGGGPGMVLQAPPLFDAIDAIKNDLPSDVQPHIILTAPGGKLLNHQLAQKLAQRASLIIICGHYEGIDERVIQYAVDQKISIGKYVLTGGELPAMVIMDVVARLVPGVVGNADSVEQDTFGSSAEYPIKEPVYTRPAEYRGWAVPPVLLSGDHAKIAAWRAQQSQERTQIWLSENGQYGLE